MFLFEVAYSEATETLPWQPFNTIIKQQIPVPVPLFYGSVYHLMPDNILKLTTTFYNQHNGPVPVAEDGTPIFRWAGR